MHPPLNRVFDLLDIIAEQPADEVMFTSLKNGMWRDFTVSDYLRYSKLTALALLKEGIQKGECVITITQNRAEFNFADMGIMLCGAIHVPLSPSLELWKLKEILSQTKSRFIFVSNLQVLRKIESVKPDHTFSVISFEATTGAISFEEFCSGISASSSGTLEMISSKVMPEDPASVIYHSGSNTQTKGVVLSHRNHVFNIVHYLKTHHMKEVKTTISFLPLAHSFERTMNYCSQLQGISIHYAESTKALSSLLREVKPEMLVVVPLVLERIFKNFRDGLLNQPVLLRPLAKLTIRRVTRRRSYTPSEDSDVKSWMLRSLKKHVHQYFGNHLKLILCGGAALKPEILNFFRNLGIPVYEGYGLTEAGPLVSYNYPGNVKPGTVGKAMHGVQVAIASDGEVMVKSQGVASSYFGGNPLDIRDGWLMTGDIGEIDKEGYLTLTGIKKKMFKLSSGLYIDAPAIEQQFLATKKIKHIFVYGHNMDFLVAVLVPAKQVLANENRELEADLYQDMQLIIDDYNQKCLKPERISRFIIGNDEWYNNTKLMNPDGSLNRYGLYLKYKEDLEKLFR